VITLTLKSVNVIPGNTDSGYGEAMSELVRKRSVLIAGHATSVSLESEFWQELTDIAVRRGLSLNALVAEVDSARDGNLSSALRLLVLRDLKERAALRETP